MATICSAQESKRNSAHTMIAAELAVGGIILFQTEADARDAIMA